MSGIAVEGGGNNSRFVFEMLARNREWREVRQTSPQGGSVAMHLSSEAAEDRGYVERLFANRNVDKFRADVILVVAGREDEWDVALAQTMRQRKDRLALDIDVEQRGIDPAAGFQKLDGLGDLRERADDVGAAPCEFIGEIVG